MIAGALFKFFDFVASHKWAQWVLLAIAVVFTAGLYLAFRDNGVRKREREKIAVRQAEVKAAVVERVSEIATEERENADHALEARSADVHYPSADSLPPDLQAIAFRNPRGS